MRDPGDEPLVGVVLVDRGSDGLIEHKDVFESVDVGPEICNDSIGQRSVGCSMLSTRIK